MKCPWCGRDEMTGSLIEQCANPKCRFTIFRSEYHVWPPKQIQNDPLAERIGGWNSAVYSTAIPNGHLIVGKKRRQTITGPKETP